MGIKQKIKNIFNTPPKWDDLSDSQKKSVTGKLLKISKALAGPRYQIVSGWDQMQREQGITETRSEDEILPWSSRGRIIDLIRNQSRNSPTLNSVLKQFDYNVVGTKGGKVCLNFDNPELLRLFKNYTRNCDFFDGLSFNSVLKLILRTYWTGDCVIVFDDGLVEDSGKLIVYEPDEIANVQGGNEVVEKHYGKGARQSQGRVYNANGRWIGCIVSRSCRGMDEYPEDKCYFLRRNPDADALDSLWIMPRSVFRFAQGRGISNGLVASLANTIDLEDLCKFELQSAKKNSQILATVEQTDQPNNEAADIPSAFDSTTDFETMSDEEINDAIKQAQNDAQQTMTMSLDKMTQAGAIYQILPSGYKLSLLDSRSPNPNLEGFIKFLSSRTTASMGLSQMFGTLYATGADFRAESVMSWPAFQECQKFLEQICDWVFHRFTQWIIKRGLINNVPDDYMENVLWQWPQMSEADELSHQDAVARKLQNLTGSLADEYGQGVWKTKLLEIKEEIEFCKANGIPHPSFAMKSGGTRPELETNTNEQKDI